MNAYYFSFEPTGCEHVDRILSAVAAAGKAYHHTEEWNDDTPEPVGQVGECPTAWIQNAANDAARYISSLEEENTHENI